MTGNNAEIKCLRVLLLATSLGFLISNWSCLVEAQNETFSTWIPLKFFARSLTTQDWMIHDRLTVKM